MMLENAKHEIKFLLMTVRPAENVNDDKFTSLALSKDDTRICYM